MGFEINDTEAEELANVLANETGESVDDAVASAIRERLERVKEGNRPKMTVEEMLAFGKECRRHLKGAIEDHGTMLYDEKGLPK